MSTELALPSNAAVELLRIESTDFFQVRVDGEPLAEVVHKDADLWKAIGLHYKIKRTRAELELGLW